MNARQLRCVVAGGLVALCARAIADNRLDDAPAFRLRSAVVGAGGAVMRGAGWQLDGTVGQASTWRIGDAGGGQVEEGFWSAVAAGQQSGADLIFADGFDPPPGVP